MTKFISDKIKMRTNARLASVQATYMIDFGQLSVDQVIKDFIDGSVGRQMIVEDELTMEEEDVEVGEFDTNYFATLVRAVHASKEGVEKSIALYLNEKWPWDRMDGTLKALLLCAVYEIINNLEVDVKVLIQEYVDLAYAFFSKSEPKMVNALLDQIAKEARVAGN
ncbi:MAG: transcription antitermination factor NusB [Lactobacillus sp.]|jgi:N utilization substance protein B|nr:transcription antitermination factor NusB [Lactobacillus sp.]